MNKDNFYIGWHQPVKGKSGCHLFPRCMISVNRLISRYNSKNFNFPVNEWIMDSGAFTRITTGKGHLSVEEYVQIINKYFRFNDGELVAVVSQDYMCQDIVLEKTGFDIPTHQRLTIERYDQIQWELSRTSLEADHLKFSTDIEFDEESLLDAYEDNMIEPDVYLDSARRLPP